MSKTVVGLFSQLTLADEAIRQLEQAGFDRHTISMLSNEASGEQARRVAEEGAGVLAGVGAGAGIGGVAGLLLGIASGGVQRGGGLVIVQTDPYHADQVKSILDRAGAEDVKEPSQVELSFAEFESSYRRDFQARFGETRYTYRQFEPAYRYGHTLKGRDPYRALDWKSVEESAHGEWEARNPNTWDQVKDAVRYAFSEPGE